ncbi:MAG TPA: hypothetical protein PLN52_00880 [Opitutaceae bacterium]|nr:hypothetical protein [Opitutaceae bacterium]
MSFSIKNRFSVVMITGVGIRGTRRIKIFSYPGPLGFSAGQDAWVGAFGIGSSVGLFFSNPFADRDVTGERFLAFSHVTSDSALIGSVH